MTEGKGRYGWGPSARHDSEGIGGRIGGSIWTGFESENFGRIGPALAEAFQWALNQEGLSDEQRAELIDELYSYGAQEDLPTSELDKIYEYALHPEKEE